MSQEVSEQSEAPQEGSRPSEYVISTGTRSNLADDARKEVLEELQASNPRLLTTPSRIPWDYGPPTSKTRETLGDYFRV